MEKKKRVTYNIAYIGVVEIKYKTVKLNIVDLHGHQELDSMLVFSHCLGTQKSQTSISLSSIRVDIFFYHLWRSYTLKLIAASNVDLNPALYPI